MFLCLQLKAGLVPFIKELREKGTRPDASVLSGTFDSKAQVKLYSLTVHHLHNLGHDLSTITI